MSSVKRGAYRASYESGTLMVYFGGLELHSTRKYDIARIYKTHAIAYISWIYGKTYDVERISMDQITRTPKQLGTVLQRYRKAAGISQETIAARIHLRQATISALENSATNARLGTLFDILAALDLELVVRPRTKGSTKEIEGIF